jgi:hypothetical protein
VRPGSILTTGLIAVSGAVTNVGGPGSASVRQILRLYADGDPDPKSGECTSVSTALTLEAKPAYVFEQGVMIAGLRAAATRRG